VLFDHQNIFFLLHLALIRCQIFDFGLNLPKLDFCHSRILCDVLNAHFDALELLTALGLHSILQVFAADESLGFDLARD